VVKQLTPDEAVILNSLMVLECYPALFGQEVIAPNEKPYNAQDTKANSTPETSVAANFFVYKMYSEHCNRLHLKNQNLIETYLENLIRLRIVEFRIDLSAKNESSPVLHRLFEHAFQSNEFVYTQKLQQFAFLDVTTFGRDFIAACIADTV
jgi:hypothetical protein